MIFPDRALNFFDFLSGTFSCQEKVKFSRLKSFRYIFVEMDYSIVRKRICFVMNEREKMQRFLAMMNYDQRRKSYQAIW